MRKLFKSERVGKWMSGSGSFEFQPGKSLADVAATTLYKVVTVLVSGAKHLLRFSEIGKSHEMSLQKAFQ